MTPAHETDKLAELVCSNSLKSDSMDNAAGLLKEEMRRMNSLILEAADRNRVPAGSALAVDREGFSTYLTRKIEQHPNIRLIRQEVTDIPDDKDEPIIVATGPLSSSSISESIARLIRTYYFCLGSSALFCHITAAIRTFILNQRVPGDKITIGIVVAAIKFSAPLGSAHYN
jgi:methylenetetrahydrofolate--tRNA-(uracil-5-)-methyltransferase